MTSTGSAATVLVRCPITPRRALSAAVIVVPLLLAPATASAATIVADGVACTLAEAIVAANTNLPFAGCPGGNDANAGGDIIEMRANVLIAAPDNFDTNGCGNGLPAITSVIRINGNNHSIATDPAATEMFRLIDSTAGNLTLNRVTVRDGATDSCDGAGIHASALTALDSTISGNFAYNANGGGLYATSLLLVRSIVSDNQGGGAHVDGTATLKYSVVARNRGFEDETGGGLEVHGSLLLENSSIVDNHAGGTGAIAGGVYMDGTAAVVNSTVSGNTAFGDIGIGGGLFLYQGTLRLVNSTVSGNAALAGSAGVAFGGSGGGIFSSGIGSQIFTGPGGPVALVQTTVVNNSAVGPDDSLTVKGGSGGGIRADALTVTNSIIANNTASNPTAADCYGGIALFIGLSLVGDGTCGATASGQLTGNPLLGPLANYGGATFVHQPLAGSPVVDRIALDAYGKCDFSGVTADQRGVARPDVAGGECDLGSVEFTGFPETAVLDDFNRPDGPLGNNWTGGTVAARYKIVDSRAQVRAGGLLFWAASAFGADQEVFVTLSRTDRWDESQALLLKASGDAAGNVKAKIAATYDAQRKVVRVETLLPRPARSSVYSEIPVAFKQGDQFGARAYANGVVEIYRNRRLAGAVTLNPIDRAFFAARGGYIGLWSGRRADIALDDFGGGNASAYAAH